jgi:hypothetical protein
LKRSEKKYGETDTKRLYYVEHSLDAGKGIGIFSQPDFKRKNG